MKRKNWLIFLGLVMTLVCLGLVVYNQLHPKTLATTEMDNIKLAVIIGYAGLALVCVGMWLKPNSFFKKRASKF
jgi:hypothetical protein